ncbi:MAG TPA: 4Fe-4S dicluster domain-containing protein [Holophaga sp.]|nr:4Fe-4S dicluster domain-containing protein [Holophaga sp.]
MTKVLMIHPDKCTGCHNCTLACSYGHEAQFRPAATRVHVYTWEREGFSVPMMCQQCDEASCMKVCPTGALSRVKGTALVDYDRAKCIGCRMCTLACPFGNAVYDGATGAVLKCDQCGGSPECVKFCPSKALEFVDDSIATRSRKKSFAAKFKTAFQEV